MPRVFYSSTQTLVVAAKASARFGAIGERACGRLRSTAVDLVVILARFSTVNDRAGINSLAIVVEQSMGQDPFQRAVFAFCNRRRDRVKLLIYDRSGFWMLLKRLEADRFHWPRSQEAVLTLTTEELHWLLDGIDIAAVRRHPVRQYHSVG
ncbi:IS66 family insertion sequence element accessory protein TnpB [Bradyrhizobium sp. CCGUVB23]|uniref:IS66 family insertion sequence element accessory protein TnpB n=1 Tax=Bradyrhizobium sp. CCGUVB23 TaxID=2949630 RepID=UPI0020B23A60|nr:IS66 family insertion sequence element accessory protein TnpB [Bradyrhizobium sp. CCGUVB23]MCP3460747.1 IS66 family insertion sequence element accessory protein TnpB [Bradyrhizobium sp. CCGUVB23]